ncbi:ACT domain-containing protein [Vulcanisaeta thermophila]|uniref:ACT domain-containing protein n=1 Tax=Vulcanisaeta thermophila TaxID=867917 RepID=UPI000852CAC7|nr:ACT domain-containing protein [Vulcanisaeta thermophila]
MSGGRRYTIELMLNTEMGNQLDPLVRALNIVRRGKVDVKNMWAVFNGKEAKVGISVEGEEDEVMWVCNKLEKLYDVVTVKYTQEEVQASSVVMGHG